MASSRRPTVLGPGLASGNSAGRGGQRRRDGPADDEDERTTVDEAPPRKPRRTMADGWEERTVQDRGTPRPKRLGEPPILDPADADSHVGTIDRGIDAETIEETTVDGGGKAAGQVLASGSNQVGLSTVDELTRDDGPRPAPRLAVVGSSDDEDEADAAPTRVAINAKLVIIGGNDRGREFPISTAKTTIGRGVDNDIVLTDIAVSRRHMNLEFDGRGFLARDLNSGNGTLVNNARRGSTRLDTGDQLEIGNTLIRFECPQATAQPPQPGPGLAADDDDVETIAGRPPPRPGALGAMPLPAFAQRPVVNMQRSTTTPGPAPVPGGPGTFIDPMSTMPVVRAPMAGAGGLLLAPTAAARRRRMWMIGGAIAAVLLLVALAVALSNGGEVPREPGASANEVTATKAPAPVATKTPAPVATKAPAPVATKAPAPVATKAPAPVARKTPSPVAAKKKQRPAKKRVTKKKRRPAKKRVTKKKRRPAKKRVATTTHRRAVTAGKAAAARKRAAARYKARDFSAAASTLRSAAGTATSDTADDLRSLADSYAAVGSNLARGNKNKSANPPAALSAYRKALSIDRRAGKGVHGAHIRIKLGEVSPKAAASFMAQRRYEAAKRACDAAVNYGAGSDPMVARVRKGLDKKAAAFYKQALKLRKGKPKQARSLLKRVLKIVPPDSRWYAKAYAMLNSSKRKPRDDDE